MTKPKRRHSPVFAGRAGTEEVKMELKDGDRIHLNGYPDKQGQVFRNADKLMVTWDDNHTTRNDPKTLCRCTDRYCETHDGNIL